MVIIPRGHRPSPARRGAFTLIELLVVIAIIAILAAILFPVFAQAREKARQTTCLSNLKQIGLAILQYNQDFDEFMPLNLSIPAPTPLGGSNRATWLGLCYPYMKDMNTWKCPDMVEATSGGVSVWATTASALGSAPYRNTSIWTAYGYNVDYMNNGKGDCSDFNSSNEGGPPTNVSRITSPAATVMVVGVGISAPHDATLNNNPLYPINGGNFDAESPATYNAPDDCGYSDSGWGEGPELFLGPYGGFEQPRHSNQGGQVCFCDGHVKFMSAGALAAGTNWNIHTTPNSAVVVTDITKYLWDLN